MHQAAHSPHVVAYRAALATVGSRGRYAARAEGGGKIVAGPASALVLGDAEAEIGFVLSLTPYGYGAEPF